MREAAGYFLGEEWSRLSETVHHTGLVAAAIAFSALALYIFYRRRRKQKTRHRPASLLEGSLRKFKFVVWLLCLSQGLMFIVQTPIWEGWDEAFHYSYIQGLVEHHSLPVFDRTLISKEITTSFQYLPLSHGTNLTVGRRYATFEEYWKLTPEERRQREERLKSIRREERAAFGDLFNYEAHQPPLYYLLCSAIYYAFSNAALPTRIFFLRLFSLLLGSATIILAFSAAKSVYSERRFVALVPLLIALLPLFYPTVARISNDSLAVMLFSALVVLMLRYFCDSGAARDALLIGIVLGLGLLTKAYFLTALPALIVVFIGASIPDRSRRRVRAHLCLIAILAVSISGWWYCRNYALYGNISGMQELTSTSPTSQLSALDRLKRIQEVPWLASAGNMAEQHIWMGNTSLLKLSHLTYRIGYALLALCVLGIARRAISALRKTTQVRSFHRPAPVLILGALYVSFVIGVFYHMLVNFLMIHVPGGTGGWYLYAAIVPEAILLVYGLQGITGRKWELAGVAMLLLYIAVVGLLSVFAKSIPSYAGFFIPNFHVQHLFQIYSPPTFKIVLQHLAANKPGFITPSLIGIVIAVYLFMVTHSLFHYAAMAESKRPAKPVYRQ